MCSNFSYWYYPKLGEAHFISMIINLLAKTVEMALFQSCVSCQNACCWDISVVKQQFKIQYFIHIWYITVFVFKFTTSNHNKEVCITFLTSVLLLVALMPPQGNWSWKNNDWIILTPSSHTLLKLNCVVNVARIYVNGKSQKQGLWIFCQWRNQSTKARPPSVIDQRTGSHSLCL